jgi:hypothetical protein
VEVSAQPNGGDINLWCFILLYLLPYHYAGPQYI